MKCESCGIEFSEKKKTQKFCSEKCSSREKLRRRTKRMPEYYKKRYNDRRYSDVIRKFLGSCCSVCGDTESVEIHHIIPIFLGGRNEMSNLTLLCRVCHRKAHESIC